MFRELPNRWKCNCTVKKCGLITDDLAPMIMIFNMLCSTCHPLFCCWCTTLFLTWCLQRQLQPLPNHSKQLSLRGATRGSSTTPTALYPPPAATATTIPGDTSSLAGSPRGGAKHFHNAHSKSDHDHNVFTSKSRSERHASSGGVGGSVQLWRCSIRSKQVGGGRPRSWVEAVGCTYTHHGLQGSQGVQLVKAYFISLTEWSGRILWILFEWKCRCAGSENRCERKSTSLPRNIIWNKE